MDENHSITLGDKQVIERTAELVFESFHSDNCVLGIVSKQGGYVASRPFSHKHSTAKICLALFAAELTTAMSL